MYIKLGTYNCRQTIEMESMFIKGIIIVLTSKSKGYLKSGDEMDNCKLLFEKNDAKKLSCKIEKNMTINNKQLEYCLNVKGVFNGDHILELISVIKYIREKYRQCIPVVIRLGEFEFYDKLVYIILENLVYYFNEICHHNVCLEYKTIRYSIWTEGINYSTLVHGVNKDKYRNDINMKHFRKIIPYNGKNKDDYLSNLLQDIEGFLRNNRIGEETRNKLSEVIIELVGNAGEHGSAECMLDIDIANDYKKKEEQGNFYGLNIAMLNYSQKLFFESLKEKLESGRKLSERYINVLKAKEHHCNYFNENYGEDDFYTISSFQHKISGSRFKDSMGGTGLTSLLKSLEEDSDMHLCYMLSGKRVLFFEKENMSYDKDGYVGFNKTKSFFSDIPDDKTFITIDTFFPGVAYNLNYAVKKENLYE